jgi:hypothetical protein
MLFVAKRDKIDTGEVYAFLDGAYVTKYANIVDIGLKPVKDFTSFLTIGFARNRPYASISFLELSHRGLTIPIDGNVLVIDQNAFSIVIAGEAKDVSELSLFFGLVRSLVGDEAERVVCDDSVLHGVSKSVLKDQPA